MLHEGINVHALIDHQTEALFHSYSQYSSTANLPSDPSEEEQKNEAEIEELLEQVRSAPAWYDGKRHGADQSISVMAWYLNSHAYSIPKMH